MRIKAFRALRPPADLAATVSAPPYDVVNTEQARRLAAGNPRSFLHISRAEIDLPDGTDPYSDAVYSGAAAAFAAFRKDGILVKDREPGLFAYRQQMGNHSQTGIVVCCHIEDYENKVIRQHEKTLQAKEADRARHIKALNAQAGPIFIVYRDVPSLNRIVAAPAENALVFDFTSPDGIRHTGWKIGHGGDIEKAFANVPRSYIADGHHRFAAAVGIGRERRATNPSHTGAEEYNWVMAVLFPGSQLRILPYNRIVRDLNNMEPAEFLARISERFSARESDGSAPTSQGSVKMYMSGKWHELSWTPVLEAGRPRILDVSFLQDNLLGPALGIDDPRTSKRIEFVGGFKSVQEMVERVDSGGCAVAFSMCPVAIEDVMAYSDADLIMPPKSTWFEPKLRSGLFIHAL